MLVDPDLRRCYREDGDTMVLVTFWIVISSIMVMLCILALLWIVTLWTVMVLSIIVIPRMLRYYGYW